jgi:hypothetical protein
VSRASDLRVSALFNPPLHSPDNGSCITRSIQLHRHVHPGVKVHVSRAPGSCFVGPYIISPPNAISAYGGVCSIQWRGQTFLEGLYSPSLPFLNSLPSSSPRGSGYNPQKFFSNLRWSEVSFSAFLTQNTAA